METYDSMSITCTEAPQSPPSSSCSPSGALGLDTQPTLFLGGLDGIAGLSASSDSPVYVDEDSGQSSSAGPGLHKKIFIGDKIDYPRKLKISAARLRTWQFHIIRFPKPPLSLREQDGIQCNPLPRAVKDKRNLWSEFAGAVLIEIGSDVNVYKHRDVMVYFEEWDLFKRDNPNHRLSHPVAVHVAYFGRNESGEKEVRYTHALLTLPADLNWTPGSIDAKNPSISEEYRKKRDEGKTNSLSHAVNEILCKFR